MLYRQLPVAAALLLCAATASAAPAWKEAARKDGLVVYNRDKSGSEVKEVRGVAVIPQPAWVLKNVIDDVARYKEFMPYTKDSRLLSRGPDWVLSYQRISAPFVDDRDYTITIHDESQVRPDGKTMWKVHWREANKKGPAEIDGVVRVQINEGWWELVDIDGKSTQVEYYVYTSPGGSVPSFLVNAANNQAVPDLFAAVKKAATLPRYRDKQPTLPARDPPPAKTPAAADPAVASSGGGDAD